MKAKSLEVIPGFGPGGASENSPAFLTLGIEDQKPARPGGAVEFRPSLGDGAPTCRLAH